MRPGEALETIVLPVTKTDLKGITKKAGWLFDWKYELAQSERQVYKLVTEKEPDVIQGLVSYKRDEGYMFMDLIESSPLNRGKSKQYFGVAANLIAYVCKVSMEYGFGGVVSFHSKTALISHYEETLGAVHLGGGKMAIFEDRAELLINKYF